MGDSRLCACLLAPAVESKKNAFPKEGAVFPSLMAKLRARALQLANIRLT
jgi:hypothetical protein